MKVFQEVRMKQKGVVFFVVALLAMTGFAQAEQGKLSVGLSLPYSL